MFFNSFFRYFLYLTGTKFILAPRVRKTNRGEKEKKGTQQEEDAGTAEKKICKKGRLQEEQV